MKKTYKIDVDCANCANKMEEAARKTEGVQSAQTGKMCCQAEWPVADTRMLAPMRISSSTWR